jgi:hypothetical protein
MPTTWTGSRSVNVVAVGAAYPSVADGVGIVA